MLEVIKKIGHSFLDIIYPNFCPGCKTKIPIEFGLPACKSCWGKIKLNLPPLCSRCGAALGEKIFYVSKGCCNFCSNRTYFFDQAFSVCAYEEIIKTCIHLFKYQRKSHYAKPLSELMLKFIGKNLPTCKIDIITAVPLHQSKLLDRGFNQAQLLAKNLAEQLNREVSFNNLYRRKKTKSQFSLSVKERWQNVSEAFAVKNKQEFSNKSILLIDDIFTTGATLNECARILKQAGASHVTALTLAR